ncbi:hypothetical protein ACFSM5_05650 [Lacibacterium aquatile]|uniref:Flagellar protein FliT n=1 Tax=Lacibacterium aquatile TaxID=1168082 RepID=A0ABW5DPB1_9PROT
MTQSTGKEAALDANALAERLTAVTTAIGDAITALERGEDIDLSGIDSEVETLCLAAAKAPPAARNNIADMLDLMTERLEILALKLRDNLGGGDEAVQEEAARVRAHDAYRTKP